MQTGAAVMDHPSRRMAVGCHRPLAQRGTSCCAVTGASSAALLTFVSTNPRRDVERDGKTERERGREGERDRTRASNQEGKETGRKRGHEKTRCT